MTNYDKMHSQLRAWQNFQYNTKLVMAANVTIVEIRDFLTLFKFLVFYYQEKMHFSENFEPRIPLIPFPKCKIFNYVIRKSKFEE